MHNCRIDTKQNGRCWTRLLVCNLTVFLTSAFLVKHVNIYTAITTTLSNAVLISDAVNKYSKMRTAYISPEIKINVISYAEIHCNRFAEGKCRVDWKRIREWQQTKTNVEKTV